MKKKILVISPPPHPQNAGNRSRIYSFLTELQSAGFEVHFVYTGMECNATHVAQNPDYAGMAHAWDYFLYLPQMNATTLRLLIPFLLSLSVWGQKLTATQKWAFLEKVYYQTYQFVAVLLLAPSHFWRFLGGFLPITDILYFARRNFPARKRLSKLYAVIRDMHWRSWTRSVSWFAIDNWYNYAIDDALIRLRDKYSYDAVMVEYVFMSAALKNFGNNTLKVIDRHDVFTDRIDGYEKSGVAESYFSTSESEEYKGLNRADVVIAIQHQEAIALNRIAGEVPIATISHIVELMPPRPRNQNSNNIIYLGSANASNIHGIEWFLKEVFPIVRARVPDVKLILAGSICSSVSDAEGCEKLGEIEQSQIRDFYARGEVAINSGSVGTGLKIKNVEALGFATPLITTPHGGVGLEEFEGSFIIADTPLEFAEAVIHVLEDKEFSESIADKAYN